MGSGAVLAITLALSAFGLLRLVAILFPGLGLEHMHWTHWMGAIVIPEIIFVVSAILLWRKRTPVAVGILATAAGYRSARCGSSHDAMIESEAKEISMERDVAPLQFASSIAPWLSVRKSAEAVEFYKAAFGALEVYRLEDPGGSVVVRLSVDGAEFWVGDESPEHFNFSSAPLGGSSVRLIFTVADPDAVFERAMKAGASQVYPVNEDYGWRIGRVVDPYGHHWEIGRPVGNA